jgi:hypothetical protein
MKASRRMLAINTVERWHEGGNGVDPELRFVLLSLPRII